jgi:hypothetical protein
LAVALTRNAAVAVALFLCTAVFIPTPSLADGDPASDVLFVDDVYLPYPAPSRNPGNALRQAVAFAYAHGFRLKVAVIATETDLGAIPSLFGKPNEYARFLGTELSQFYVGPLLIVMPAGYGIYDGGRSTSSENAVLARVTVDGSSPDALVNSATKTVQLLVARRALRSKDIVAPYLYTQPLTIMRGKPARLLYKVADDSHRTRETLRVQNGGGKTIAVVHTAFHPAYWTRLRGVKWTLPDAQVRPGLRYCIVSEDAEKNASKPFCDKITVAA